MVRGARRDRVWAGDARREGSRAVEYPSHRTYMTYETYRTDGSHRNGSQFTS